MDEKYSIDVNDKKIHWSQDVSYGDYLQLGQLLNCHQPRSEQHDEHLFIIIHQISELWMKLALIEMRAAARAIANNELDPAFKMMSRVAKIQEQLINAWDVLISMTPADYVSFRESLGQSSGFQSFQYREMEFLLGNKNAKMVEAHANMRVRYQHLKSVLHQPSIYDVTLQLLAKRGFIIPKEYTERDWSQPYRPHPDIEQAWLQVYRNTDTYWDLYELAEKLVDAEYSFQQWRFSHMKTVERIIGFKRGTGGTAGVHYLKQALELKFFPELWSVRTLM